MHKHAHTHSDTACARAHIHTHAHIQILTRHKKDIGLVLKANIRTSLAAILWDLI